MNENDHLKKMMREELTAFFSPDQPEGERFLDVTKIPRICEDLRNISYDVSLFKKMRTPVR